VQQGQELEHQEFSTMKFWLAVFEMLMQLVKSVFLFSGVQDQQNVQAMVILVV